VSLKPQNRGGRIPGFPRNKEGREFGNKRTLNGRKALYGTFLNPFHRN